MDEDDRHAFNDSFIGLQSTKKWTLTQWRTAVAKLQSLTGMDVAPGRPRLKHDDTKSDGGDWATSKQVGYIEHLAERIHWRANGGLQLWIRKRMVADSPTFSVNWSGKLCDLPRETATKIIVGLQRWATMAA